MPGVECPRLQSEGPDHGEPGRWRQVVDFGGILRILEAALAGRVRGAVRHWRKSNLRWGPMHSRLAPALGGNRINGILNLVPRLMDNSGHLDGPGSCAR